MIVSRCLALVLVITLLVGCSAPENGVEKTTPSPEVIVIALDGFEPSLARKFMAEGRLPRLQRLVDNGAFATIDCVVGSVSPVVWTTVATGVSPERHGITDFTIDGVPATSTVRRNPAFWNILPRFGLEVATIGWLASWPAEADSGIVISQRAHWGDFADKVAPIGAIDPKRFHVRPRSWSDVLPRFTSYPYNPDFEELGESDPAYGLNFLVKHRLIEIAMRDASYSQMAREVVRSGSLDLLAVYFQGPDYVSHGFWKYFEPEPFRAEGWVIDEQDMAHLETVIPSYYGYIDFKIGELLDLVPDEALVIVLSDHGFGPALGNFRTKGDFLSGNHRFVGSLILSGPQVINGTEQRGQITHYDILPTLLYALDLPLARDFHGSPLLSYFDQSFIESRTLKFVNSYDDDSVAPDGVTRSEHDDEILDELRSLGYID